jgi:RNA polymerase sigma-70 factor (ECF subfamily)
MMVRALALEPELDLEALYRAHARTVRRFAATLSTPEELDDIVQDVFLIAGQRLHTFRGEADIRTWLYAITRNVVRYRRRGAHRAQRRSAEYSLEPRLEFPTPEELLERKSKILAVNSALGALDDKYRRTVLLHAVEGLSGTEIAAHTGVEPKTVWVRLHRARALLKAALIRGAIILFLLGAGAGIAKAITYFLRKDPPPPATNERSEKGKNTSMKKLNALCLSGCLAMAPAIVPAIAAAEEPAPEKPAIVYQTKTVVEFSDLAISAEIQRPEHSFILSRTRTKFPVLVRIRSDFQPELLRSVDAL